MAGANDKIKVNGVLEVYAFKMIDGMFFLEEHFIDINRVVNNGLEKICLLLGNSGANNYISQIGVGTDGTETDATDSGLTNEFKKSLEGITFPTTTSIECEFDIDLGEYNGNVIREYGLFTADSTLFARKVKAAINKENDIYIRGTWTITVSYTTI